MYEAVGDALLGTLRAFAGPAFTPAAQQAWTEAYEAISALMIKAAEDASALAPAWWSGEVIANDERHRGISVLTIAPDQRLPFQARQHITVQTRVGRGCGGRTRSRAVLATTASSSCTSRRYRAGGSATRWSITLGRARCLRSDRRSAR